MRKFLVLSLLFPVFPAGAKDFGRQGHTYDIAESDLLKQITGKLYALQEQGALQAHQQKIKRHAERQLRHPTPVKHITKAKEGRTFFYDPSIRVPFDLRDHEGRAFHKKGEIFNPLKYRSLSAPLIFIAGNDAAQVAWATKHLKQNANAKIILTSGSPFELMERLKRPVYFDQGGRLTQKLGIRHVPALVVQEGLKLKISEILVEEEAEALV